MAESFGERLTKLRFAKGWKKRPALVAELKKHGVEITPETIRLYEENKTRPKRATRSALAKVFGVREESLEFLDQPDTGRLPAHEAQSGAEELLLELFRGLLPDQRRESIDKIRALFEANNYIRRQMGMTELRSVSNARVRQAFGDVPTPKKPKPPARAPRAHRRPEDPRGAPVDDE